MNPQTRLAMLAALSLGGLMGTTSGNSSTLVLSNPYAPRPSHPKQQQPLREPPPLTPEQLKAQAKRDRKTRKLEELNR